MEINISSNIKEVAKRFGALQKDIPFIAKETINEIAFNSLVEIKSEVEKDLHISKKPIPNAWRVKKATKTNLNAKIYVKEDSWQFKVLRHHYIGGDRTRKGLEKALIHFGLMTNSEILTPSPGIKVKASVYNRIISQLRLGYKAGYDVNETEQSKKRKMRAGYKERFFVIPTWGTSHLSPGIYIRLSDRKVGDLKKPICMFRIASKPHYKQRLDAEKIVRETIKKDFVRVITRKIEKAWQVREAKGWDK